MSLSTKAGQLQVSPDRREFRCEHCGKVLIVVPHEQTITLKLKPLRRERCEVTFDNSKTRSSEYRAEVFTPAGKVLIGSAECRYSFWWDGVRRGREEDAVFRSLETSLLKQGWQKVGNDGSMRIYERYTED
jgi:phage FluMu protein Com